MASKIRNKEFDTEEVKEVQKKLQEYLDLNINKELNIKEHPFTE